jgi:hypothetical protein
MAPRIVLAALAMVFVIAAVAATVTAVRQLKQTANPTPRDKD